MGDIAYQNKDVTAKVMAEALKGKSLAPFGIHQLKIVDILPTNLPVIESNELRLDNLFLLSDGSIGIMDYESAYNQENFVKYINYIARVIKRYAINHELDRIKQIKMIVIYTADVDHAEAVYDLGGIVLKIEPLFGGSRHKGAVRQDQAADRCRRTFDRRGINGADDTAANRKGKEGKTAGDHLGSRTGEENCRPKTGFGSACRYFDVF